MANLELFIAVLGDSPESRHAFRVDSAGNTPVDDLRKSVFAARKSCFEGSEAADLVLWKVTLIYSLLLLMC